MEILTHSDVIITIVCTSVIISLLIVGVTLYRPFMEWLRKRGC